VINLNKSMWIRENLHDQALTYLRLHSDDFENLTIKDPLIVDPCEIIFGRSNDDWLSGDPDSLKGEYKITIILEGADLEMEEK